MNTDEKPLHIRTLAINALITTTVQHCRTLHGLAKRVSQLHRFVYGYTIILEPNLVVREDEILNWTFVDVCDDLNAALWNLACGFYKPAGAVFQWLQTRLPLPMPLPTAT